MRARYVLFPVLVFLLCAAGVAGRAQPKSEGELVMQTLTMLSNKDALGYKALFPDMDLISQAVLKQADTGSSEFRTMYYLRERPDEMNAYGQVLDSVLMSTFNNVLDEAAKMNIHWPHVLLARYELEKQRESRDAIYEKVVPERFLGYVFIKDPVDNATYCYTIGDLMQIQGKWYGGTLTHIFEASTKFAYDQQLAKYKEAKRKGKTFVWKEKDPDSEEDSTQSQETKQGPLKTVVERKYYTGTFDNEIPVQLYVRYLKGTCPEGVCSYEAVFKFGDQDEYVYMSVVKTDNHWVFTEDPGTGVMDLQFKESVYTGAWTSSTDQTGYEVHLSETVPGNKKLRSLDQLFIDEPWKKSE